MTYYKVSLSLPQTWKFQGQIIFRDIWVEEWSLKLSQSNSSFSGVFEGHALVGTPIFDTAEAPSDRDLVSKEAENLVIFYFTDFNSAECFANEIERSLPSEIVPFLLAEKNEDWNAKWKEHFRGVELAPDWKILPHWMRDQSSPSGLQPIYINPGMGFGSGEHPTTALCLSAIGRLGDLKGRRVLDFGSGSGILAIASALRGAEVDAVEIDSAAIENAKESCEFNNVHGQIHFFKSYLNLDRSSRYSVIVANILSSVLISHANFLVGCLASRGKLILSGILREQVDEVYEIFRTHFDSESQFSVEYVREWAALHFQKSAVVTTSAKTFASDDAFQSNRLRPSESLSL